MKPARFSYEAPGTLPEVLAALARHRDGAKVIAGGQSLAPMMNMRLAQPVHLIDINGLSELAGVRLEADRLVVGALVRHGALARDPLVRAHAPMLARAAETIGHYAIRQRGTLGGSLAHADPAAQLPLAAVALGAQMELVSAAGRRTVQAEDFFQGIFTTALEPDELLTALHVPLPAAPGWGFRLFARRAGDFAIVSTAVALRVSQGRALDDLRVAAGGIAPAPQRLDATALLTQIDPRHEGWAARAAAALADAAAIEDNERIPSDYRRELLAALLQDALADAWSRAR
ncbi:MAG: FAD binding domain-containing protein [Variibacter sp.]|nr:FAD binding domain-containing protein [Variibacter sp.]